MKNYKYLIPIVIVFFSVFGCYTRLNESANNLAKYNNHISMAREYRDGKIYVDALVEYKDALAMKNTMELCLEVGEMFVESNDQKQIEAWGRYIVEEYPKRVEGYEYLVDYYMNVQNYEKCFSTYEISEKRKLFSPSLQEKMDSILYEYEIDGKHYETVSDYSYGYAVASSKGIYGYVGLSGKYIVKAQFLSAGSYGEELCPVMNRDGELFFADINGDRRKNYPQEPEIEVTRLGVIGDGMYPFGNDEVMYFANLDGQVVLGPYDDATSFYNGFAAIKQNNLWYMIDVSGNVLSQGYLGFVTDSRDNMYRNGVAFAKTHDGIIMIDSKGTQIGKQTFEDAKCFLDNSYAAVKINGSWGFVDNKGDLVIEASYEEALPFYNNLAAIKIDDLWGYINDEGRVVIEPVFEDAKPVNSLGRGFVKEVGSQEWKQMKLLRFNHK